MGGDPIKEGGFTKEETDFPTQHIQRFSWLIPQNSKKNKSYENQSIILHK